MINPILYTDFYKTEHHKMYPEGTTMIYSNFTPRKSRLSNVNSVVFFGLQAFIKEFLINRFNKEFFLSHMRSNPQIDPYVLKQHKDSIFQEYSDQIKVDTSHLEQLWDLGYLPIKIKALEEGTLCPIGVPCLTIVNTHPDFYWLTNYLETLISCQLWQPITSATIAHEYRKLLSMYAKETTGDTSFVQWQGHDFSMRGMSSIDSAILSGMGHLTSFTGTDTIPAIYAMEKIYSAEGLIGASVPATEHSVMCMGEKESEINTFKRLLDLYPTGILSVVSDTWDLWKVCTEYLPALKDDILARDGKLVIRPDSGDPADILCGTSNGNYLTNPTDKGVIELLWDTFGGYLNDQGYRVLNSHIGAIYGDSITLERAKDICEKLKAKGFASTNVVFGIGSYTYQYNTRDTFGFAMKATYGEVNGEPREIFKSPITDDGTKISKKGLLSVSYDDNMNIVCLDQCTTQQEEGGILETVFINGSLVKSTNLSKIREKLWHS